MEQLRGQATDRAPIDFSAVTTAPDLARLLRRLRRREARRRDGPQLTLRQLAAKTGWSVGVIGNYFTGVTLPPTERLDTLVRLLGADAREQGILATARDNVEEHRRTDRTAGPGVVAPGPRQLPPDVTGFVGRDAPLAQLDALLGGDERASAGALATISGIGGVGKTALAVRWGHRNRGRFPDGELYVDLRGYSGTTPVPPIEALARFLRSLGVPAEQIPAEVEAAAARYRSALATRRMLILLDNVSEPGQVRPLLPGAAGCVVLVTSRDRLSGLAARDGAHRLILDVLSPHESRSILSHVLGDTRVAAEPDAADDLARACSHLPLALRIAAVNLSDHPQRRIAEHVTVLREDRSLATLEVEGDEQAGVRRTFDLSYQSVGPDGQKLFRLLGLVPGPDVTVAAAAALADLPVAQAGVLLDRLAGAHLAYEHAPGRYTCHDLVRQYAADRAGREHPDAARRGALARWYAWCLSGAGAAAALLYPQRLRLPVPSTSVAERPPEIAFTDPAAALAWLDDERANLVAAIFHAAADHGARSSAWLLADALRGYFWIRRHLVDWCDAASTALTAAEGAGDLRGQAAALLSLGDAHARRHRYAEAIAFQTRALALSRRAGWVDCEAAALGFLGTAHRHIGQSSQAVDYLRQAIARYRDCGSRHNEAVALGCLGGVYRQLGQLAEATNHYERQLALHCGLGFRHGEALALNALAEIDHIQGRLGQALHRLSRALPLLRECQDGGNEAFALRHLAATHRDAGRLDQAVECAEAALALSREGGDHRVEAVAWDMVAAVHHRLGEHEEAVAGHQEALRLARSTDDQHTEVEALLGLAAALRGVGQDRAASEHAARALVLAGRSGFRLLQERAVREVGAAAGPAGSGAGGD